ncbi:MAG TPA: hypothetical protein VNJ08_01270 [Bacteriovoracaceae bacterium]|nr:hypothetical protein [Bacteriovoracaceae bacterium]
MSFRLLFILAIFSVKAQAVDCVNSPNAADCSQKIRTSVNSDTIGAAFKSALQSMTASERHQVMNKCSTTTTRIAGSDGLFKPTANWMDCFAREMPGVPAKAALASQVPKMRQLQESLHNCTAKYIKACTVILPTSGQTGLALDDGETSNVGWSEQSLALYVPVEIDEVIVKGTKPPRPPKAVVRKADTHIMSSPGKKRSNQFNINLQSCEGEQTVTAISLLEMCDTNTKDGQGPIVQAEFNLIHNVLLAAQKNGQKAAGHYHQELYIKLLRLHAMEKMVKARALMVGHKNADWQPPQGCVGDYAEPLKLAFQKTIDNSKPLPSAFDAEESKSMVETAKAALSISNRAAELADHPKETLCKTDFNSTHCHTIDHTGELTLLTAALVQLHRMHPLLFATIDPVKPLWDNRELLKKFAESNGDVKEAVNQARSDLSVGSRHAIESLCKGDLPEGVTDTDLLLMGIPEDFAKEHPALRESFQNLHGCLLRKEIDVKRIEAQDRIAPFVALGAVALWTPLGEGALVAFTVGEIAINSAAYLDSLNKLEKSKSSFGVMRACLQTGDDVCKSADLNAAIIRINEAKENKKDAELQAFIAIAGGALSTAKIATPLQVKIPAITSRVVTSVAKQDSGHQEVSESVSINWSEDHGIKHFKMKVSPEELARIKMVKLDAKDTKKNKCIGKLCNVTDSATGIAIPAPFNQTPSLSAAYLAISKDMGFPRVANPQLISKDGSISLIVKAYDKSGKEEIIVVPIE